MATVNSSTDAAQVSMRYAPFQTQALTDTVSQDNAMLQNRNSFKELQEKRNAQEKLRQQLIDISSAGLPKIQQGELNYDVDRLVERVRSGELNPDDFEFRSQIAGIEGKYSRMVDYNSKFADAAMAEGYLLTADENGNPMDIKNEFMTERANLLNSEYNPDNGSFTDVILNDVNTFGTIQKDLGFDFKQVDNTIKQIYELGAEESAKLLKDKFGYIKKTTDKGLSDGERTMVAEAMVDANKAALRQVYATSGARSRGENFDDWALNSVLSRMPKKSVEQDFITDLDQAQRAKRKGGASDLEAVIATPAVTYLNKTPVVATTINMDEDIPLGDGLGRVRRMYYDPKKNTYTMEYVEYEKVGDNMSADELSKLDKLSQLIVVSKGGSEEKYRLDKSKVKTKAVTPNSLDWNAMMSAIAKTTKSEAAAVSARIAQLGNYTVQDPAPNPDLGNKTKAVLKGTEEEEFDWGNQ